MMHTRRSFVSAAALAGAAAACPHCAAAMGGTVEVAQAELNAAGGNLPPPPGSGLKVPAIAYDVVPDFIAIPEGMYFGECSGVAVNSQGHVFVLSRGNTSGPAYGAAATQLLEFGSDGKFVREIGQHLYAWSFAHTVKLDRHDNIWVTDKGSDMIVKFTPAGRVAMVFGRKQEASDEGTGPLKHPKPPLPPEDGRFRQVTDVAWDSDDNTYISDGYINSRIAKADKDGVWLSSWGTPGNGPLQFNTPHSIALDAQNRIYVADRGNRRIQVLDRGGNLLRQIHIDVDYPADAKAPIGNLPTGAALGGTTGPGAPWAIAISPPPNQFLFAADAFPGRIYKMTLDGTVVGVLGRAGKLPGQFGWIHQMAAPSANTLYVAEVLNWRVQKLLLHA
jgi:hypothetical protein